MEKQIIEKSNPIVKDYMTGMEKYHEIEEGYSYFIVKMQPCLILEKMEDENV